MRTVLLLLAILSLLEAQDVVLSGLIGSLSPSIRLGGSLDHDIQYQVRARSKVQMMIDEKIAITASANSRFAFTSNTREETMMVISEGTYKIVALSAEGHAKNLIINTPMAQIRSEETIALIDVSSKAVQIACLNSFIEVHHADGVTRLGRDKMLHIDSNEVFERESVFEHFDDVYIKSYRPLTKGIETSHEGLEDPTDLEN